MIIGRNPVLEILKSDNPVNKIIIGKNIPIEGPIKEIINLAKKKEIEIKFVKPSFFENEFKGEVHQGVAAETAGFKYTELKDVLNEKAFLICLEHVKDPHNLGAVIRTAEALGADAVIITKRESVEVTDTVFKSSAGAASHLPIVKVSNLSNAFQLMKRYNIEVIGLDGSAKMEIQDAKLKGPVCFVLGSEGEGLKESTINACDYILKIPMKGKVSSLNVSVSAAIAIYEKLRQSRKD